MSEGRGGGSKGQATRKARSNTADAFRYIEQIFYILVAAALAAAGAGLLVNVIYSFFTGLGESSFLTLILGLLDGLLLVFITTELLHTVRAVIDESVLLTEPFLIVGMVAVIRRLILISAEAKDLVGTSTFGDLMLEMGILTGVIVALGFTIFMLRHTHRTEPRPYDPDVDESDAA